MCIVEWFEVHKFFKENLTQYLYINHFKGGLKCLHQQQF